MGNEITSEWVVERYIFIFENICSNGKQHGEVFPPHCFPLTFILRRHRGLVLTAFEKHHLHIFVLTAFSISSYDGIRSGLLET